MVTYLYKRENYPIQPQRSNTTPKRFVIRFLLPHYRTDTETLLLLETARATLPLSGAAIVVRADQWERRTRRPTRATIGGRYATDTAGTGVDWRRHRRTALHQWR